MKSTYNYLNQEDLNRIIEYIPQLNLRKLDPLQVAMMFKIAYWLALRMIETRKLKAEQFDFDRREVYLGKTKTKTNDSRTIPVLFIPELQDYLRNRTGNLFDPIPHRKTIELWANKIGHALDIEAWTTPQSISHEKTRGHIFRKSLAKDMLYGTHKEGRKAPITVISNQLGHSNPLTTTKYLRVSQEVVKDYWEE